MRDTLTMIVKTENGNFKVILEKDRLNPDDQESGMGFEPVPTQHNLPEVSLSEYRDIAVRYLLNLYPNISSIPPKFGYDRARQLIDTRLEGLLERASAMQASSVRF